MSEVTRNVEHDGGWPKVGDVFGDLPTHAELKAAKMAAKQKTPGDTEVIEFEDLKGKWHTETARAAIVLHHDQGCD